MNEREFLNKKSQRDQSNNIDNSDNKILSGGSKDSDIQILKELAIESFNCSNLSLESPDTTKNNFINICPISNPILKNKNLFQVSHENIDVSKLQLLMNDTVKKQSKIFGVYKKKFDSCRMGDFLRALSYILEINDNCTACCYLNNKFYITSLSFGYETKNKQYESMTMVIENLKLNNFQNRNNFDLILDILIDNTSLYHRGSREIVESWDRENIRNYLFEYFNCTDPYKICKISNIPDIFLEEKIVKRIKRFVYYFEHLRSSICFKKFVESDNIVFVGGKRKLHCEMKLIEFLIKNKSNEFLTQQISLSSSKKPCLHCYYVIEAIIKSEMKVNIEIPKSSYLIYKFVIPDFIRKNKHFIEIYNKMINTNITTTSAEYSISFTNMIKIGNNVTDSMLNICSQSLQKTIKEILSMRPDYYSQLKNYILEFEDQFDESKRNKIE
jgi:hypothetical protein